MRLLYMNHAAPPNYMAVAPLAITTTYRQALAVHPDARHYDARIPDASGPFLVAFPPYSDPGEPPTIYAAHKNCGYALVADGYEPAPAQPAVFAAREAVPPALAAWLNDPNNDLDEIEGNLEQVRNADEPDTDPSISEAESILRDAGDTIEYAKANVSSLLSLIAILKEVSDVESSD